MRRWNIRAVFVLALALLPSAGLCRSGEDIFQDGVGSAPILARIGTSDVAVPAERVPCSGCHGPDRMGRTEGGITAPDITAGTLGAPAAQAGLSARTRPAYDGLSLARAITKGIDAAGQPLAPAMPRYGMGAADLEALVGYLTGNPDDAGATSTVVRIELAPDLEPDRRAVELALAEVNGAGGIHGRRLELGSPGLLRLSLRQHPAEQGCGPARLWLQGAHVGTDGVGLLPDATATISALAAHLAADKSALSIAGGTEEERMLAKQAAGPGAIMVDDVAGTGGRQLLWLGNAEELARFMDPQGGRPTGVVALLDRLGPELMQLAPPVLGTIRIASPLLPADWQRPEALRFVEFARTGRLPLAPRTAAVYAGVQVAAEALRRVGRVLSADRLCDAMSTLGKLDTGALSPLRIAPGRLSAMATLHLVGIDPETRRFLQGTGVPIP